MRRMMYWLGRTKSRTSPVPILDHTSSTPRSLPGVCRSMHYISSQLSKTSPRWSGSGGVSTRRDQGAPHLLPTPPDVRPPLHVGPHVRNVPGLEGLPEVGGLFPLRAAERGGGGETAEKRKKRGATRRDSHAEEDKDRNEKTKRSRQAEG